jgi:hypothetical protein
MEKQAQEAMAEHQKLNAPKPQTVLVDQQGRPITDRNRTKVFTGNAPQNRSEWKLVDACKRDGVGYAETHRRLLALRADMQNLKPAKLPLKLTKTK